MTTASPIPAAEVAPRMADPPDTTAETPPARAKASQGRPRLRDQAAENPLLTLFGTIIVALLVFVLGTTNLRIADINNRFDDVNNRFDDVHARIDDVHHRIDRLEDAMLARFAAQDAKISELDAKIDEMNLKLTALIAHLDATDEADNALNGHRR
ncbi:MAG: hypothetical protein OXG41_15610 [Acidimicrobiaceae bacterium]|nr:hypothetical protein [Acidimicrobiaceae bacterium]